jgi:N-acetylmuramic acid 6-phosphate (MurNAc-6-P) etherase
MTNFQRTIALAINTNYKITKTSRLRVGANVGADAVLLTTILTAGTTTDTISNNFYDAGTVLAGKQLVTGYIGGGTIIKVTGSSVEIEFLDY